MSASASLFRATSEQRGNTVQSFKDFHLKAQARIWPYCFICSIFTRQMGVKESASMHVCQACTYRDVRARIRRRFQIRAFERCPRLHGLRRRTCRLISRGGGRTRKFPTSPRASRKVLASLNLLKRTTSLLEARVDWGAGSQGVGVCNAIIHDRYRGTSLTRNNSPP